MKNNTVQFKCEFDLFFSPCALPLHQISAVEGGTKSSLSDSLHIFNAISGTPSGTTLHGMPSSASSVWLSPLALNIWPCPQPERWTDRLRFIKSERTRKEWNLIVRHSWRNRPSISIQDTGIEQVCPVFGMSAYYSHKTRVAFVLLSSTPVLRSQVFPVETITFISYTTRTTWKICLFTFTFLHFNASSFHIFPNSVCFLLLCAKREACV